MRGTFFLTHTAGFLLLRHLYRLICWDVARKRKRNIAEEILQGLQEIKAHYEGKVTLRTFQIEEPSRRTRSRGGRSRTNRLQLSSS
jgi:hypothetical protein